MSDLTTIENPDRIVWVFVNKLAKLIGGENVGFDAEINHRENDYFFKIITSKNCYGCINIGKKRNQISKNNLKSISRAVGILAVIIESVEQRLLIEQERKQYHQLEEKKNERIFQNLNIYRQILENSDNIILYFNRALKCLYANNKVKEIQQDIKSRFSGLFLSNINISLAVKSELERALNFVVEKQKPLVRNISSHWNNRTFEFRLTPEFNMNDEVEGIICFAVDITDKIKIEKDLLSAKERAEESDMLKLSFLTNISHEIRTPLNGIIGFSKLMVKSEQPKEKVNDFVQIIENNSNRLLKTLSNIIEVSKLQSGELKIYKEEFRFHDFIYNIYRQFKKKLLGHEEIEFCFSSPTAVNNIVYADSHLLEEVIWNLLDNAFKFTNQGKVVLGYFFKGKKVFCFVKDTGIGIKKSKLMLIFNKFYQADQSVRKEHEGLGLGLTLSKELIEKMGGKIWIESIQEKGTTVHLSLPYGQEMNIDNPKKIKNGFAKAER